MSSNLSITVISPNPIGVTSTLFDLSEIKNDYKDYQFDVVSTNVTSPTTIMYRVGYTQKLFTVGEDGLLVQNPNRKSKQLVVMTNSLDASIEIDDYERIPLKDGLHSVHIIGSAYINNDDDVTVNDVLFKFVEKMKERKEDLIIILRDDILNESTIVYNEHMIDTIRKTYED